jgi:hypothetical protein
MILALFCIGMDIKDMCVCEQKQFAMQDDYVCKDTNFSSSYFLVFDIRCISPRGREDYKFCRTCYQVPIL